MTVPSRLWAHVHISEREVSHHWPDGQWDDSAFEDCTFDSNLMLARICHDAELPYTHIEAEHLRDDAGEDPLGGTSSQDAVRGLERRYGWSPRLVAGFDDLWADLTPGRAAAAQGSMGAFPYGHRLRRFQPNFDGAHDIMFARVDTNSRVWADDPLAPLGSYQGEWWSRDDLRRYVNALSGRFTPWATVGAIRKLVPPDTSTDPLDRVRVAPGAWWDYAVSGSKAQGYTVARVGRTTAGFSAEITTAVDTTWGGAPRSFRRLSSGAYAGRWVDLTDAGSVTLLAKDQT